MVSELLRRVDFDPALHSRARLKIMMVLVVSPFAAFNDIVGLTELTPGNLATHMKALENVGYVRSLHVFVGQRPRTRYQMTPEGKAALKQYCERVTAAMNRLHDIVEDPSSSDPPFV